MDRTVYEPLVVLGGSVSADVCAITDVIRAELGVDGGDGV
jgi:hypothetical protein